LDFVLNENARLTPGFFLLYFHYNDLDGIDMQLYVADF